MTYAGTPKNRKKNRPWGLLGDIEFELATSPRSFSHKESATFAEHAKIEGKPGLQWVGDDLQSVDLAFRFDSQWCDPDAQLRELQQAMADHLPMTLTLGTGTFKGNFVIEDIRSRLEQTDAAGNTIQIEVQVSLKETNQIPKRRNRIRGSVFRRRGRAN